MSEILDNIYISVFSINSESVLLLALVKYMLCGHFTQNCIFFTFWRLKILVLWQKIAENLLIFVCLFFPKNGAIDFTKNLHNSRMVGRRKLPDPLLNHIFNALSIGVQYTVSFESTNFGLNCLLSRKKKKKFLPSGITAAIVCWKRTFQT